jgi:hypothetical protein
MENFQHQNILAAIRETRVDAKRADDRLAALVSAARGYGISWQSIGHALGTSKQAAWERYGSVDIRLPPRVVVIVPANVAADGQDHTYGPFDTYEDAADWCEQMAFDPTHGSGVMIVVPASVVAADAQ